MNKITKIGKINEKNINVFLIAQYGSFLNVFLIVQYGYLLDVFLIVQDGPGGDHLEQSPN